KAADAAGADLFIIETMADLLETKAAVLACKENSDLPIFCTMTFEEDGRTFLGTSPEVAAITLDALGVNVLGVNCSLGPADLAPVVKKILSVATCPVMLQANAGLPTVVDGKTIFSVKAPEYAQAVAELIEAGVSVVGGCCGTTPAHIQALNTYVQDVYPAREVPEKICAITSAQQVVALQGHDIATIGERINPTGKKRLKAALTSGDFDYVIGEAIAQTEAGCDILDVNAGLPEIDEAKTLVTLVGQIQSASGLPLQIDSSDPKAVEAAVRVYSGKPLINSVNGKAENLREVLPIVQHYGCAVVGLTLNEAGIPPTADERFAIARHIVDVAAEYGIHRKDIFIDALCMAVSTNQNEALEILRTITKCKQELGVRTVLGVSNISFGLPLRPIVNAGFLSAAFAAGLDLPILNPLEARYREVVDTWKVICAQDVQAQNYINTYAGKTLHSSENGAPASQSDNSSGTPSDANNGEPGTIHYFIITGRKAEMKQATKDALKQHEAMEVINDFLIPALDEVGNRFEKGTFFLPQLMASAEAAKVGFDVIKETVDTSAVPDKGALAVATVKGDIHDIGKNIVKMLLENYGYTVYDLGRDVPPQAVLNCVLEHNLKLVGLSALMTTTVRGMEETISLLREHSPQTKIMVGGAVLNEEYAKMVGADYYGKDAAATARIAAEVLD
ncbi:MAG: dihydropteroate synthase, partial [Eggerthellaceae bacterium]|nr:dihydropteroate synthase [Eggerthellaceae bacterium]